MAAHTTDIAGQPDFEITSVLCYSAGLADRPGNPAPEAPISHCYLLQYAIDRLHAAAVAFSMSKAVLDLSQPDRLTSLAVNIEAHLVSEHGAPLVADKTKKFIVRLAYSHDGTLRLKSAAIGPLRPTAVYFPAELAPIAADDEVAKAAPIYVDTQSTAASLFMTHKTSYRGEYDAARARHGGQDAPPAECDVLLYTAGGDVTGSAFSTVYFDRGGLVTPSSDGCKLGVSRRWAVTRNLVREGTVTLDSVREGECVWTSTAVTGFTKAHITLKPRNA